jgi:hypothetical protein
MDTEPTNQLASGDHMSRLHLRREGVSWTDVDGEIVALDEETAVYLAANESGGMLWRALSNGSTRDQLGELLCETYDLAPERAAADIDAFLAALREKGLLAG